MILEHFSGQLLFGFFYGLTMIVSWAGYGWFFGKSLKLSETGIFEDLGLYAGWGISFWLIIGGILQFFSAISPFSILLLLVGGVALAIIGSLLKPLNQGIISLPRSDRFFWILIILAAFASYGLHTSNHLYNPNDDFVVYSALPYQMLETGTCIQPYSWRRQSAYGGQNFLNAAIVSVLPPEYINIFDRGCCPLLIFIILVNRVWQKGLQSSPGSRIFLLVVIFLPSPAINESAHESTLFFALVLVFTYERLLDAKASAGLRDMVMLGLISAAYYTLKAQMLVSLGLFYGIMTLIALLQRRSFGRLVYELTGISGFAALFLVPWAYVQYQSCGTFLYPILKGNEPLDFMPTHIIRPFTYTIGWIIWYSWYCKTITAAFVIYAIIHDCTRRRIGIGFVIASVLQLIILGFVMSGKMDGDIALIRYDFGFLIGAAFWCVISRLEQLEKLGSSSSEGFSVFRPLILISLFFLVFGDMRSTVLDFFQVERRGLINYAPGPWTSEFVAYRSMQSKVPAGEPIMVFSDYPFLFDFARNPILLGDIPGACSPPPHMPMFRGPDALRSYLIGNHIHYIIHSDFTRLGQIRTGNYVMYSIQFWADMGAGPYEVWQKHAPYFLDVMNNILSLQRDNNTWSDGKDLTCLDLGQPASQK